MRLRFFDQKYVTAPYQYLMSLLVRKGQVNEMLNEATQLIEDQIRVGLELDLSFFFFRLD